MAQTTQCGKIDTSKSIQIPNKKDVTQIDNGTDYKRDAVLSEWNKGLIPKDGQQINTCPQSHYNNKYKSNYKEWIDSAINKFNSGVTTWANIKQTQDSNYATLVAKIQATNANIKNTNESKSLLDTSSNQNIINTNNASKIAWNTLQQSIADEKTAYARYNNHQQIYTTFKQEFTEEGGKFVSAYNAAVSKWETNHWKVNNNNLYTNIDKIEVTKDLITITLQNATTISHSTGYTGGDSWHIVMLNKDKDFSIVGFPMSDIYPSYNTNNNNNNCQWKDMYDDIQSICKKKNYENNIIILISPVNNNGMDLIKPSIETIGSITPVFFKKILEGCGYSEDDSTSVYDTIKDSNNNSNNNNIIVGTVTSITTWPPPSTYIQTCSTSNTDKLLNNCIYNTSNICEKGKYFLTDNTCETNVPSNCTIDYKNPITGNKCKNETGSEICGPNNPNKTYYYDGTCNNTPLIDCINKVGIVGADGCSITNSTKCDNNKYYYDKCSDSDLPTCSANGYKTNLASNQCIYGSSNEVCNTYYYDGKCNDKALSDCTNNTTALSAEKCWDTKTDTKCDNTYYYNGECTNAVLPTCQNHYTTKVDKGCLFTNSSNKQQETCKKYYYDNKCNNTQLKACSTNETSTVGGSGCEYGNTQKCAANYYYYDNKCNSSKKKAPSDPLAAWLAALPPICFPLSSFVRMDDNIDTSIENIDINSILANNNKVTNWIHYETRVHKGYMRITTEFHGSIIISPNHIIKLYNGSYILVGSLLLSDSIIHVDKHNTHIAAKIINIEKNIDALGLCSPLTSNKDLIVNGFKVSCYSYGTSKSLSRNIMKIPLFNTILDYMIKYHCEEFIWLCHYILFRPLQTLIKHKKKKNTLHPWVKVYINNIFVWIIVFILFCIIVCISVIIKTIKYILFPKSRITKKKEI